MTIVNRYKNGNCFVSIYSDGTKVRESSENPAPEFPESLDIKITNKCQWGCPHCHESSSPGGGHAGVDWINRVARGLPPGVEFAIGGGNPLEHSDLADLLYELCEAGIITNMTINSKSLPNQKLNLLLRPPSMIRGLGITWDSSKSSDVDMVINQNAVIHLVLGVSTPEEIRWVARKYPKVLILGYKHYGRGEFASPRFAFPSFSEIRRWVSGIVSFDNLAIEQLSIKDHLDDGEWGTRYMGDDGQYTMYIDAVKRQYAKSSTSERHDCKDMNIKEMFANLKGGLSDYKEMG